MQVLGDLIRLPIESDYLPLPWWHRAPLGLQSRTWCYLSVIPSPTRPVGDLVVSVLDPHKWAETIAVQAHRDDRPGVISDVIATAYDMNIALAESVTIESGSRHEVTLICETGSRPKPVTVKKRLRDSGLVIDSLRSYPERDLAWTRPVEIQSGWIGGEDWRAMLAKLFGGNDNFNEIDLGKAVVSADTGNRLLRFVFPYKGSRTISVEHRDTPGAMKRVTDVFFDNDLNVLSLLLRRGGARPDNAILVAACEPKLGTDVSDLYSRVRQQVESLPPRLMAEIRISSGLDANRTIAPREPGTVVARIPKILSQRVADEQREVERGRLPVFFSRRFVNERRALALAREVRAGLRDNGAQPLEAAAQDQVGEQSLIFIEVTAKMWVAHAGVVLVTGLKDSDALGKNLPHEFGFLQGQAKPILLLVEGGNGNAFKSWSNIDGVHAPRFAADGEAMDRESPLSIYEIVKEWLDKLGKRPDWPGTGARI